MKSKPSYTKRRIELRMRFYSLRLVNGILKMEGIDLCRKLYEKHEEGVLSGKSCILSNKYRKFFIQEKLFFSEKNVLGRKLVPMFQIVT